MKTQFLKTLFVCMIAVLMTSTMALAQTVTGSITGIVTDPSDAVVSGAKVVAHNVATGVDTPTVTNNSGFYLINQLPVGHYTVNIDAKGFGKESLPEFSLESVQIATFNVKLTVGGGSSTVSVSAASPILNTNDAVLQSTFTANTIENMPLNGLDFSALTLYVPGSVSTAGTSGATSIERSTYFTDTVNLNGNRAQANNFTLEGIDMNETFNNLISYSPAPGRWARSMC